MLTYLPTKHLFIYVFIICCILHMLTKVGYVVTACRTRAAHHAEAVQDSAGAPVLSAQSGSCSSFLAGQ